MAETVGDHRFVAVVQVGSGLGPAAATIEVALDGAAALTVQAAGYAPGDVRALDPAAVTRLVPPPGATTFEPNLFVAVELAHPALPWALSPPGSPRLPWLALVVVEDGPGVRIDRAAAPGAPGSIDVLVLDSPVDVGRELPDLTEAWAWVHAHGTGAAGAPIDAAVFGHSAEPTCARLLCPRRLAPSRQYHAALVPVFRAGVRAALGEPVDRDDTALAWTAATVPPLRLPAYRSWSFRTGLGGDFASLARRIGPHRLDAADGVTVVDAAAPGWGLAELAGRTAVAAGMVRPEATTVPTGPDPLGAAILALIDAAPAADPVLPPPLYGGAAAAVTRAADAPAWLVRTNGEVRLRIAAGAGAAIVRARQDELVDAAWRQLGDAEAANRVLRHVEAAAAINDRVRARYVEPVPDAELLQVIRPAFRRMRLADPRRGIDPGPTLGAELDASAVPSGAATTAYRRIARPGGRVARRVGGAAGGEVVARANTGDLAVVPPRGVPDGGAAFDDISIAEHIQPRWSSARSEVIAAAAEAWKRTTEVRRARAAPAATTAALRVSHTPIEVGEWTPPLVSELDAVDVVTVDAFAIAAQAHQAYLAAQLGVTPPRRRPPLARGQLGTVRQRFLHAAAPARAVLPVIAARLDGHALAVERPFRRVAVTPTFERPLLRDLAALDLAQVLPGIDRVPADVAALLEPDHDAVAALLTGANHELANELRWRGFPGDGRATPLRTFWGRTARDRSGAIAVVPDVPELRAWPAAGPPPPPVGLVLLLRGELFRRYPNAVVYLAAARWSGAYRVVDAEHRLPLFRAGLDAETVLYGFDLDRAAVVGGPPPGPPGWYVAIAEHPQEPRFGLGAGAAEALDSWRELAWAHVTADDLRGDHLVLDGPLAGLQPTDDDDAGWGIDAARQAAITLRRPTRIAIHASLLVR